MTQPATVRLRIETLENNLKQERELVDELVKSLNRIACSDGIADENSFDECCIARVALDLVEARRKVSYEKN